VTVLSIRPPRRRTARVADRGARRGGSPRSVVAEDARLAGRSALASFTRYADAERALDRLAAARFPVHRMALIGGDVKLVEEVTGRLTARRSALFGGVAGAWLGALMALFAVVAQRPAPTATANLLLWGVLLGTFFGAPLGAVAYSAIGRDRDFTSRRRLVAGRYELYADAEVAGPALRLLMRLRPAGMAPVDVVPVEVLPVPPDAPTAA
jgi:hypothetical protein